MRKNHSPTSGELQCNGAGFHCDSSQLFVFPTIQVTKLKVASEENRVEKFRRLEIAYFASLSLRDDSITGYKRVGQSCLS